MRLLLFAIVGLLGSVGAIKLRAEPYSSSDPNVRAAKQRLLSMDATNPGIRYRVGDQLTRLVDLDSTVKTLDSSVQKFQTALSQIAGVIDLSKTNNGLVPRMKNVGQEISRLDQKLSSSHRQAAAQIMSLYNKAKGMPTDLAKNMQQSVDNLVKTYNQLITNQVNTLERQREQAVSQATADTKTLGRTIQGMQQDQMIKILKLIKQMQSDRADILSESSTLNAKFLAASTVVNTALTAVKEKSVTDLTQVQSIVGANQKALSDYIIDQGDKWMTTFQATIDAAAKQATKSLNDMSVSLSTQFGDAKKKAASDLSKVDATVDSSVTQIERNMASIKRRFDLAIQNATKVTNDVLLSLKQPIQDINDQIAASQSVLSGVEQDATSGSSGLQTESQKLKNKILSDAGVAGNSIEQNPGFTAVANHAANVYKQASDDMQSAEASANNRVAALTESNGRNQAGLAEVSQGLQEQIDQGNRDFQTAAEIEANTVQGQVDQTSQKLGDQAAETAAKIDDVKAKADGELADMTDRTMNRIGASHEASVAAIGTVNEHLTQQSQQAQSLIEGSFNGIISDSNEILSGASGLLNSTQSSSDRIASVSNALNDQNNKVNEDLESANGQIDSLRQLGSNAVDEFYQSASASSSSAVADFSKAAGEAVDQYKASVDEKVKAVQDAQDELTRLSADNQNKLTSNQATMKANLQNARDLLNALKSNSTITGSELRNKVDSIIQSFKSGSLAEVSELKSRANADLRTVSSDMKAQVDAAGDSISTQTKGFLDSLASLSRYVSDHSSDLGDSVESATGAVNDFKDLVDKLVSQIQTVSSGLDVFYQNSSRYIQAKLDDTEQYLNDTDADTRDKIDSAWYQLEEAMSNVDGSTASKIKAFERAVNESVSISDGSVANFTEYIEGMIEYEKKSAASRLAIQRGLLESILQHSLSSSNSTNGTNDVLEHLKAVLAHAQSAVNSSSDSVGLQKNAQDALLDAFGAITADKVNALMGKLSSNAQAFSDDVSSKSSDASSDSNAMLQATGLGVSGIVGLAGNIANAVGVALDNTQKQLSDSQIAMAALSAETGNLSNITQAQLAEVLRAMMASQTVYSGSMDDARNSNTGNIATISGVIHDFVALVNQTLGESDDLIASVDANYSDASAKLGAKMDTVIGYISRQANEVSESSDNSNRALKALLTKNGAMEDGIRARLGQLSDQQDQFAKNVHDQLQEYITRLNEDTSRMNSARNAATSKLYQKLQDASNEFAANAAAWQSERVMSPASSLIETMSDEELMEDVLKHAQNAQVLI